MRPKTTHAGPSWSNGQGTRLWRRMNPHRLGGLQTYLVVTETKRQRARETKEEEGRTWIKGRKDIERICNITVWALSVPQRSIC